MITKEYIRRPLYYIVGCLTCCFCCCYYPRRRRGCVVEGLPIDVPCDLNSPLPRKRALTLPIPLADTDITEETRQITIEQSHQSLLFAKLPLELRIKVYQEVLAGKTIHILQRHNTRPVGYICLKEAQKPCSWWICHRGGYEETPNLTALLLTCRQAYSEAIDILYSGNTFHIIRPAALGDLQFTILPQRFDQIRSLQIDLQYHGQFLYRDDEVTGEDDEKSWQQLWQIISGMRGRLRDLRAWFKFFSDLPVTSEQEARFFRPLMALDWVPTFEVQVSWPANQDSETVLRKAPFRLLRITEDHF